MLKWASEELPQYLYNNDDVANKLEGMYFDFSHGRRQKTRGGNVWP
jgi:hypothetical protein